MGRTAISPELILELVRACPALKELALPSLMCLGRPFYEALRATRPTLERISLPHCGNDGGQNLALAPIPLNHVWQNGTADLLPQKPMNFCYVHAERFKQRRPAARATASVPAGSYPGV